jgi:hypothetical protein
MGDCIPHRSALSNIRRRSATAFACDFTIPESPEKIKSSRRRNSSITGESSFLKTSLNAGAIDSRWFDECCRELRTQLMVNSNHDIRFVGGEETFDPQLEFNEGRSARQNAFPAVTFETSIRIFGSFFHTHLIICRERFSDIEDGLQLCAVLTCRDSSLQS